MEFKMFEFVECDIGFFAISCSLTCPYPTYGRGCQNICNCTKDMCDYVQGCLKEIGNVYKLKKWFIFLSIKTWSPKRGIIKIHGFAW